MKKFSFGQFGAALVAATLLAGVSASAEAADEAGDLAIAAKLGGNWSALGQPNDARGEPTLLSGSAFTGLGFTGGVTALYELAEVKGARFELEAGLLYSYHSGEGFESLGERKRTVTLTSHIVHVPVLVHMKNAQRRGGFRLGVGLVPMLGLQSGATVVIENSDQAAEPLETTPAFHLGLSAVLGYDFELNSKMSVPLEIRVAWDPAVGETTRDRFPDFASTSDTGAYQVAYNWQIFFMTGLRYEL